MWYYKLEITISTDKFLIPLYKFSRFVLESITHSTLLPKVSKNPTYCHYSNTYELSRYVMREDHLYYTKCYQKFLKTPPSTDIIISLYELSRYVLREDHPYYIKGYQKFLKSPLTTDILISLYVLSRYVLREDHPYYTMCYQKFLKSPPTTNILITMNCLGTFWESITSTTPSATKNF